MTNWKPSLAGRDEPKHEAIVRALAQDVARGALAQGARLPTHRQLAERLGVSVGTVTRAYGEAQRRGLISGEVGRGSFVRRWDGAASESSSGGVDFSLNLPAAGDAARRLAETLGRIAGEPLGALLDYQPEGGLPRHRQAGARWLEKAGVAARPEDVVVVNGAQHGMAAAFMALARPGDAVLTEALTFHGMKELAAHLGLQLHGLAMDAEGILPDAFADAARALRPTALYCMPNLQNPTAAVMGEARRQAIVEIARRHAIAIVEDDVYGFLLGAAAPPPLASLAPELAYHITSLSKSLAPGLRLGYVATPPGQAARLGQAVRATCRMAAPLMAEIAARWIEGGDADALVEFQRREAQARQRIAADALAGLAVRAHPRSFHCLVATPAPWEPGELARALKERGVLVLPAETFAVGRAADLGAVRVCLGAARDRDAAARGLALIAATLKEAPRPMRAVV